MGLIWTLIIGLLIGAVARIAMPGRDPGGVIVTVALGLGGAFTATCAGRSLGLYRQGDAAGFLASIIGAVVLLAVYRLVARRPRGRGSLTKR